MTAKKPTKFYHFRQNNSGGSFRGPVHVVIEASGYEEANRIAKRNGVYFDGCDSGLDCSCCGDRWYRQSEYDDKRATPEPTIYGAPPTPDEMLDTKIVRKERKK